MIPRWVRGLIAGASLAVIATTHVGCGLDYVARNISPLHVTGWSFAFPILPSQSQRLEEDMMREEHNNKVPILDPIPGEFAPAVCLDPPSEAEVRHKVPKFRNGCPPFYETQRNNVRILIEKIGEKIDPCKIYPLAGPASWSTVITSARCITTSSTGRTTRSRSITSITRSRSSTSTRTISAAAADRPRSIRLLFDLTWSATRVHARPAARDAAGRSAFVTILDDGPAQYLLGSRAAAQTDSTKDQEIGEVRSGQVAEDILGQILETIVAAIETRRRGAVVDGDKEFENGQLRVVGNPEGPAGVADLDRPSPEARVRHLKP